MEIDPDNADDWDDRATSGSNSSTALTSEDALQASCIRRSEPTMCSNSSPTDYDDDPFVSDSYLRYNNLDGLGG